MDEEKKKMILTKHGIGGSRIAAVAGLSPWSGPADVWMELFGLAPEKEATSDLLRGKHLGPALCKWYSEQTGMHVSHLGRHEKTFVQKDHPRVMATPDGLVGPTANAKRVKVLEVKAPRWTSQGQWGEPGSDQVPEHYIPQVTWEMAATGLELADVGALIDGELRVYTVRYNQRLFEALLDIVERFWRDHVETRKPPPPDSSEGARTLLIQLYPRPTADLVEAAEAQVEELRRYEELRHEIREREAEKAGIEARLMEAIGEHEGLTSDVANAYWRMRDGKTKWKGIAEELLGRLSADERAAVSSKHTGAAYRHFQVYSRRKKGGK